eukprot:GHVO01016874.1.p1 GENE.GHVO01016874.1~~GHVO01016874.1.p1  ORF type:complete len:381 (+),score=64.51 GHVO01016874.1:274-1416(+)
MDPVTVVGYPVGGDNTSVTQGVVSRIDLQQYSMGSSLLLAIQIDAAINPGNSGGPALNNNGQCVGIAFQVLKDGDTENIGYIIPSEVASHFLKDFEEHGKFTGFGDPGFTWQNLENKSFRKSLNIKEKHHGVLVKKVENRRISDVLKSGDILLSISGVSVASDGRVPFRTSERIPFTWLVAQMYVGEKCKVKFLRDGIEQESEFIVEKNDLLVPTSLPEWKKLPYLIVGGLVFIPLTEPLLRSEYGDQFESRAPIRLLELWLHGSKQDPNQSVVVLSHILAHSLTHGLGGIPNNTVLKCFNGVKVNNLKHLAELVDACERESFRFDLDYEDIIMLDVKAAKAALPEILRKNMIPESRCLEEGSGEGDVSPAKKGKKKRGK